MKLYISGGMTGYKEYNFPKFNEVAQNLRKQGYQVINPAELVKPPYDKNWSEYLKIDIEELTKVDGIVVLEDWNKSKGATIEVYIGIVLDLPVFDATTMAQINAKTIIDQTIVLSFLNN